MSLDILILKKHEFSKLQKIDQSYPKVTIKATNIKDMNIKILFFYSHIAPHFSFQKRCQKNDSLFIYNNYINFNHTWGNFDWPIKVTPSVIKVTQFDRETVISL